MDERRELTERMETRLVPNNIENRILHCLTFLIFQAIFPYVVCRTCPNCSTVEKCAMPSERFPTFAKVGGFIASVFSAIRRRIKRMRPRNKFILGTVVLVLFATAALYALSWLPCKDPTGIYNARLFFGCMCADSKAILVVTPNHHWCSIAYHSTPENHEDELLYGTWERNPDTGLVEFTYEDKQLGTIVFAAKSFRGRLILYLSNDVEQNRYGPAFYSSRLWFNSM